MTPEEARKWQQVADGAIGSGAVFPLQSERAADGGLNLGVHGTGFFVSGDGHFATVCHAWPTDERRLFYSSPPREQLAADKDIREKATNRLEPLHANRRHDLLLGRVAGIENATVLPLAAEPAKKGDTVLALGFPYGLEGDIKLSDGVIQLGKSTDDHGRLVVVMDTGPEREFDQTGFQKIMVAGFTLNWETKFGMSGGPIVNASGQVVGILLQKGAKPQGGNVTVCAGLETLQRFISEPDKCPGGCPEEACRQPAAPQ